MTSVVERTRVLAAAKNTKLLLLIDRLDEQGCWVDGDGVKLERAMVNPAEQRHQVRATRLDGLGGCRP